jgi:hypothetical protein
MQIENNEMVQGPCAHLGLHEMPQTLGLKVIISSASVVIRWIFSKRAIFEQQNVAFCML